MRSLATWGVQSAVVFVINTIVGTAIAGAAWLAWRATGTPPPWAAFWWFVSIGTTAVNLPITLAVAWQKRRRRPLAAAVAHDPAVLRFGGK